MAVLGKTARIVITVPLDELSNLTARSKRTRQSVAEQIRQLIYDLPREDGLAPAPKPVVKPVASSLKIDPAHEWGP